MAKLRKRWALQRDCKTMAAIERRCFPRPWQENDFVNCLRRQSIAGEVVGRFPSVDAYVIYETFPESRHIELLNLCVDAPFRSRGIGRAIVESLARRHGIDSLVVNVWERNLGAIRFFEALGFSCIAIRRGYYPCEIGDDAYTFMWGAGAEHWLGVIDEAEVTL